MRIAFDVGNVLVDVDFEEFFRVFRSMSVREDPFAFLCDIQARQDIGIKTLPVALKARFGFNKSQIDRLITAWNHAIVPNEEMLDFVDSLKENGTKVAILSNMGLEHAAYIREVYPRIFDGCTLHLSCEVGARKPTKLYYQSFLIQNPHFSGAIFLDDRPENVETAKEFRLNAQHWRLDEFSKLAKDQRQEKLDLIKGGVYHQMLHGTQRCHSK